MKTMLETLSVAFSMFSVLPVPRCAWSEKNMRFALCAFPLVGAVVGAAWWLWCAVCALVPNTWPKTIRERCL